MKNDNFNTVLEQSGLSMYALSKRSGVPYTTINEIHRGKNDINQCAASTVCRLAAALSVSFYDIINEIHYLDGVKGKYKGIEYVWGSAETSYITFDYEDETVTIDAEVLYNIPSRVEYYNIIAGWMIKEYLEHLEWEAEVKTIMKGRNRKWEISDQEPNS